MGEIKFLGKRIVVCDFKRKKTDYGIELLAEAPVSQGNYILGRVDFVGDEIPKDLLCVGDQIMYLEYVGTFIRISKGICHRVITLEDVCCILPKDERVGKTCTER
jgi:co-chaperonin GroES (HSP10)